MVTVSAIKYLELGHLLEGMRVSLYFSDLAKDDIPPESNERREMECRVALKALIKCCEELDLSAAQELASNAYDDLPRTRREFDQFLRFVMADVKKTTFLYIPLHLAKYYELIIQSFITTAFPLASKELVWAGNALACGLYTASVFHSMRAAEIGVRVLGTELGVQFPDKPIELAEWQNILDQCDSKIVKMKEMSRGIEKDDKLGFYSQAAVQFRYFKDAWRVRVAHARENYEEVPATRVFSHTLEFFETLANRLKEPKPSV